MSAFFGLVSSTVQAVATATPAVVATVTSTPSPSPAVVSNVHSVSDTLNALAAKVSVADLVVAAGVVTTGVQYLINHIKTLRVSLNWLLSFALPLVGAVLASVVSGHNDLKLAPVVYLVAQFAYFLVERIKATVTTTEPTVNF